MNLIQLVNVTKTYNASEVPVTALKDINVEIEKRSFVSFLRTTSGCTLSAVPASYRVNTGFHVRRIIEWKDYMMDQTITAQPKVKHKTFTYHTNLTWLEKKSGTLSAEGKPSFRIASPPEFKGEAGVWTPEDLFVASVEICTMATFMAFAQRLQLPVVSYKSNAEGLLEFIDGGYRFTKIVLKPEIIVRTEEAVEQTHRTLDDAHDGCLIANSINAEVVIEPVIRVLNAVEKMTVNVNEETKTAKEIVR